VLFQQPAEVAAQVGILVVLARHRLAPWPADTRAALQPHRPRHDLADDRHALRVDDVLDAVARDEHAVLAVEDERRLGEARLLEVEHARICNRQLDVVAIEIDVRVEIAELALAARAVERGLVALLEIGIVDGVKGTEPDEVLDRAELAELSLAELRQPDPVDEGQLVAHTHDDHVARDLDQRRHLESTRDDEDIGKDLLDLAVRLRRRKGLVVTLGHDILACGETTLTAACHTSGPARLSRVEVGRIPHVALRSPSRVSLASSLRGP